jgi:hypothetical protein
MAENTPMTPHDDSHTANPAPDPASGGGYMESLHNIISNSVKAIENGLQNILHTGADAMGDAHQTAFRSIYGFPKEERLLGEYKLNVLSGYSYFTAVLHISTNYISFVGWLSNVVKVKFPISSIMGSQRGKVDLSCDVPKFIPNVPEENNAIAIKTDDQREHILFYRHHSSHYPQLVADIERTLQMHAAHGASGAPGAYATAPGSYAAAPGSHDANAATPGSYAATPGSYAATSGSPGSNAATTGSYAAAPGSHGTNAATSGSSGANAATTGTYAATPGTYAATPGTYAATPGTYTARDPYATPPTAPAHASAT